MVSGKCRIEGAQSKKRGRTERWCALIGGVGLTVLTTLAAGAGDESGDDFDPRTIPADERIAYVNRLLDCGKRANAAKHYEAADKASEYTYALDDPNDPATWKPSSWVNQNEAALTLRMDWPAEYEGTVAAWLKLNESALAALRKGTELEHCCVKLQEGVERLHQAAWTLSLATGLRGVSRILNVQVISLARQGQWDRAYEEHLRLYRIAAQMRQIPLLFQQLFAAVVERVSYEQLFALLGKKAPHEPLALLKRIQAERDVECADELENQVALLVEWDHIESHYQWAAEPVKYPKVGEDVDLILGTPDTLEDIAGPDATELGLVPLGKPPYADTAAYRAALQESSPDKSLQVSQALFVLWQEFADRPPCEALSDVASYVRRRNALVKNDPVMELSTWAGSYWQTPKSEFVRRARLAADRAAVDAMLAALAYRADKGRWPSELKKLVPDYLQAVPIDGFRCRPLVWQVRSTHGTCKLYSVGPNQHDDGGELSEECDDIVYWPPQLPEYEEVAG